MCFPPPQSTAGTGSPFEAVLSESVEEEQRNATTRGPNRIPPSSKHALVAKLNNILEVFADIKGSTCEKSDELITHQANPWPKIDWTNMDKPDATVVDKMFREMFSSTRHRDHSDSIEKTRSSIASIFQNYGLESYTQPFSCSSGGGHFRGKNVFAILPGKNRNIEGRDKVLVLGAHFDTVASTPGVDDNGSGMVTLLEVARILAFRKEKLGHTIIFVAFDLEEAGLFGSKAFVLNYLIPKELVQRKAEYVGAVVMDMLLHYDEMERSQQFEYDFASVSVQSWKHLGLIFLWSTAIQGPSGANSKGRKQRRLLVRVGSSALR